MHLARKRRSQRCGTAESRRFWYARRTSASAPDYWYVWGCNLTGSDELWVMRRRVVPDGSSQPMEKAIDPSRVSTRIREENDKFKRNLLRKRRTYTRYFDDGLSRIDSALRRVAIFRGCHGTRVVTHYDEDRKGNVHSEYKKEILAAPKESVGQMKEALRGVADQKEKNALKKYGLRCVSRRSDGQRRADTRALNWELTQKKREKRERDRAFDVKLEGVGAYYAAGGRQPERGEHLGGYWIYGSAPSWCPLAFVALPPTRDPTPTLPFYFDEQGNRIRISGNNMKVLNSVAGAKSSRM